MGFESLYVVAGRVSQRMDFNNGFVTLLTAGVAKVVSLSRVGGVGQKVPPNTTPLLLLIIIITVCELLIMEQYQHGITGACTSPRGKCMKWQPLYNNKLELQ
jgi:drug/metabolite transporter (DMT)-like permease